MTVNFTSRLENVMRRNDLDVEHVMLLSSVEELSLLMFQALRLAVFQQEQLVRLAKLVPADHAGEAELIIRSGEERGEAIAADYAAWAGPGLEKMLAEAGVNLSASESSP